MCSGSHKILRGASLLVFVASVLFFALSQVVTVASRRVPVRDKEGQIIGDAWIPHDYVADEFLYAALMVLSGMQLWTIRHIPKGACDTQ